VPLLTRMFESRLPAAAAAARAARAAVRLVDVSVREGPCGGGTAVWLHGEGFVPSLAVRFGNALAHSVRWLDKPSL
jgi:hypothetical protein